MTYVITEPYIDIKDKSCLHECPVAGLTLKTGSRFTLALWRV
jgi:hypothetical protein